MASRLSELIVDCREPEKLAAFWCEVLGFTIIDREGDSIEIGPEAGFGGLQPTLIFSPTDNVRPAGRFPLHIDVNPVDRDQDAELERLLALGAVPADVGQTGEEPWHVLADPEGNVFCLLERRLEA